MAWARDPESAGSAGIISTDGAAAIMLYTQASVCLFIDRPYGQAETVVNTLSLFTPLLDVFQETCLYRYLNRILRREHDDPEALLPFLVCEQRVWPGLGRCVRAVSVHPCRYVAVDGVHILS